MRRIRASELRAPCAVALLALSLSPALAQSSAGQSSAAQSSDRAQPVNPQQPEQSLEFSRAAAARPKPGLEVPHLANKQVQADTKPFLKLRGISIVGAHAISAQAMVKCYASYIGKVVSQADLAQIAENISQLYRDAGYHLSRAIVPVQDIKDGRVVIQVIEGSIAEIVLNGDSAVRFGVARILDPIKLENPSQFKTFERHMLLANELPGVRIADSSLEEIGTATGKFRLTVSVETWGIGASAAIDNLGSAAVGYWETLVSANVNSAFVPGDTLAAVGSTIANRPDELAYGRVSYDAPIGDNGVRVGATGWYSSIWPGDYQRLVETHTDSTAGELRGSFVPFETQQATLRVTAAFGAGYFTEKDEFGRIYQDNVRTLTLAADGTYNDALGGKDWFLFAYRQGLPILGATPADDPMVSQPGASGVFSVVNFNVSRIQQFTNVWSVRLAGAGQWASVPLMFSQQFYLGGAAFGRGFDAGEISGDNGVAGTAELRFDQSLPYHLWTGYQLYGFVDSGAVWDHNNAFGVLDLVSTGVGGRVYIADGWQAGAAIAFPVSYRTDTSDHQGPRFLFSLSSVIKACTAETKCLF